QELRRRGHDTALAQDGLEEDGAGLRRAAPRDAFEIVEGRVDEARQQRDDVRARTRDARRGEAAEGPPVESVLHCDDLGRRAPPAYGTHARELDRAFVRLGP